MTLLAYRTPAPKDRAHVRRFERQVQRALAGIELAVDGLPLKERQAVLLVALKRASDNTLAQQNYDRETEL